MKAVFIEAFARAFGMLVFSVVLLWYAHRVFPSNWMALIALYFLCAPLAAIYGWLVGPQSNPVASPRPFRVPGLLLIGIAVVTLFVVHAMYETEIKKVFYGN
jgi:hypothetical protein